MLILPVRFRAAQHRHNGPLSECLGRLQSMCRLTAEVCILPLHLSFQGNPGENHADNDMPPPNLILSYISGCLEGLGDDGGYRVFGYPTRLQSRSRKLRQADSTEWSLSPIQRRRNS
jgi:hypothetical protein